MNAESFLKEELPNIDQQVNQKKLIFTYDEFSLSDLLAFAATEEVFFYESKDENFSFLGLGIARTVPASSADQFVLHNPDEVLVYQGNFENTESGLCYLPEWSFTRKNGKVTLTVHQSQEYKSYSPSNIIFNSIVWESFIGPWVSYEETPDSDEWKSMIDQSSRLFRKAELEKIVLSRKKVFTYDTPIEMMVMFREIYQANKESSHFSVYHQFNYHQSFISLTPERLFTMKGRELETISLAGSIARGKDSEEDSQLESCLINSDKLIREHSIVTSSIESTLRPLVTRFEVLPLTTMKLPYIQHRQAVIRAQIKDSVTSSELISVMHPTPAVGGIPSLQARAKILEIEKENRNYYAAPVGIISKDLTEIIVGIRSALIQGEVMTVYGGAGIVQGSIAEDEWSETGAKMQPFIKVINKSVL